jgi:hypothetical protein
MEEVLKNIEVDVRYHKVKQRNFKVKLYYINLF